MTKSPSSSSLIKDFFEQNNITDIECIFPDVTGYPRGKLMPGASFAQSAELRICQAIPMQAVTGEYSYDPIFPDSDPDVRLVPDLSTLRLSPWSLKPRAVAIHDCIEMDGSDCVFAPRSLLKKVLQQYQELGLSPVVAPEIEFYLISPNADPSQVLSPPLQKAGRPEVGQSAFSMNALNEQAAFWDELKTALQTLQINADTWIHEVGTSQFEINLMHGNALEVADQAFYFKYAAKEIALKHGLQAVFMAKPISGQAGSSMHLHQSIVNAAGHNIFSHADGTEAAELGFYISGLQRYTPDLMLIYAPNVNSYRRYVEGSQAPINMQWGYENRTTGIRIPTSSPVARRVENRLAGADANPYLAIAASLVAGLAGLQEKIPATPAVATNGYNQDRTLPKSQVEAIDFMQNSDHAKRLLGANFVQGFCAVKALEYDHFQNEVSAWERRVLLAQV
jgi:glutamine synthetase